MSLLQRTRLAISIITAVSQRLYFQVMGRRCFIIQSQSKINFYENGDYFVGFITLQLYNQVAARQYGVRIEESMRIVVEFVTRWPLS